MDTEQLKERIGVLGKKGKVESNAVIGFFQKQNEYKVFENSKSILCIDTEPFRLRCYYWTVDRGTLPELLLQVDKGAALEIVYKEDNDALQTILDGGFYKSDTYIRIACTYTQYPYTIPETGRRAVLENMYDPSFGEYPNENDVDELFTLNRKLFNEKIEEIFTKDKWLEVIHNKECFVYREDDKIVSYTVWKIRGRSIYTNISVNLGPANYLYNLERRKDEIAWNQGIRTFYAWFNIKNKKALRKNNPNLEKIIKVKTILYNDIFIKE